MNKRSDLKDASLLRILVSSAARLRKEGLSGTGIATVMKDAGLTHGTFYSHFSNKEEMLVASLKHALVGNRTRWICDKANESWPQRLQRLAKRYLTEAHRDDLSTSCAFAALVSEVARSNSEFRRAYEGELHKSIDAICGEQPCDANLNPARFEEAVMFLALCIGGMALSRAVDSADFSGQILAACQRATERIVCGNQLPLKNSAPDFNAGGDDRKVDLKLEDYAVKTYEKLRYADTDRQGHVNNAVFSTMLETGRVEILYDQDSPLAKPDCAFVIASQKLDFHSEITWPGRVDIGTRVAWIGRSSMTLEQALFQGGELRAAAKTVIVQLNETTRRSEPLGLEAIESLNRLKTRH